MKGSEHPPSEALKKYTDGALSHIARGQVYQHLQSCDACRETLDALTRAAKSKGVSEAERPTGDAPAYDPMIGRMLGEYRVLEPIGQGGMGKLYKGEQPLIGKQVAIKVVLNNTADQDKEALERMVGEARAVNAVRHPNIVDIFSFGFLPDGRPYLVMELLEGQSLADLEKERGPIASAQTISVLDQVMSSLEAAHAKGLIHRDLKPENLFVHMRPDGWRVKVLDFGLALRTGALEAEKMEGPFPDSAEIDPRLTKQGVVMGTPLFMAPEQAKGLKITDRTDIYAMGAVAWGMLTGQALFIGGNVVDVLKRHLKSAPPPIRPLAPGVPPQLEALVLRMLDKDPLKRPTASEVRRELFALQPSTSVPVVQAQAAPSRGRPLRLALFGLLAGVAGAAVWLGLELESARREKERVEQLPIPHPPQVATPKPVEVAPPLAVVEPVDAGPSVVVETPKLPSDFEPTVWACERLIGVGPIVTRYNGEMQFFSLQIAAEPQWLMSSSAEKPKEHLKKAHKALSACKGTSAQLVVNRFGKHGTWATDRGIFFPVGPLIDTGDFTIEKAPGGKGR